MENGGAAAPGPCGYHDHPAHLPASAGEGKRPVHGSAGRLCEQKSLISLQVAPESTVKTGSPGQLFTLQSHYNAPAKSGSIGQYLAVFDTCQKRKTREATNF